MFKTDPDLNPELVRCGCPQSSVLMWVLTTVSLGWIIYMGAGACQTACNVTHIVDGPQPESHLPILVLTEDDFPQPWADLCPPDADVCPRHWTHHPTNIWAEGHCHLLERRKQDIKWQEGNWVTKREVRGRKESRGMLHSNSDGDKKEGLHQTECGRIISSTSVRNQECLRTLLFRTLHWYASR